MPSAPTWAHGGGGRPSDGPSSTAPGLGPRAPRGHAAPIPSEAAHTDLTSDANDPNALLLSNGNDTWSCAKSTEFYTKLSSLQVVKSITRQPSGQIVQTQADYYKQPQGSCATKNIWCTDTVDF